MEKFLLTKPNGHRIPCIAVFPEEMRKLVIVIHGYDSSKESENAANLMRTLPEKGYGVIAYDQPNHGSEEAAKEELSVGGCLESLARVEEYAAGRFPDTEICYFGSSYGAYILGMYLARREHRGNKAFMRCAAVNFPDLARAAGLYVPEMEDLFTIFENERPADVSFAFVHGEIDSVVAASAAISFASRFGYPMTVIPGEEHPICTDPASPIKVARLAMDFYRE